MHQRLSKAVPIFWLITAGLLLGACSRSPSALVKIAVKAEGNAKDAYESKDSKGADKAAVRAEGALEELKAALEKEKPADIDPQQLLAQAEKAAGTAREYAHWAEEEDRVRDKLSGLQIRTYDKIRGPLRMIVFASLAPAAEFAGKSGLASLSSIDQELAKRAWNLVQFAGDRQPTNGSPDWAGAAADLRAWVNKPPPRIGQYMALAFMLSGLTDLALCEIESVNPQRIASTNAKSLFHAERSIIYVLQGFDHLAKREMDQAIQLSPGGWQGLTSTQALSLLHLGTAYNALKRADWLGMRTEITKALQVWPDNPLAIFLTAEQMSTKGEWAKAADWLETRAGLVPDEWLAKRMTQRAQELRESKGKAKGIISEPLLLIELATHTASKAVTNSSAATYVLGLIETARSYGNELSIKLRKESTETNNVGGLKNSERTDPL